MSLSQGAETLARSAHSGQYRRDGVTPYIAHPAEVVRRLGPDATEEAKAVAWLHDTIEDGRLSEDDLIRQYFPVAVIEAVDVLTKKPDVPYMVYIFRVRSNLLAKQVKIADMLANLADDPTEKQIIKYAKALSFLYGNP